LDTLSLKYDRVLFLDADEVMTAPLYDEIRQLDWAYDGYFVKGRYCIDGKTLKYGLVNTKLCLFDRRFFQFPVIDDLDIDGMGEIEGHYQPVAVKNSVRIGRLRNCLLHYAFDDKKRWADRHAGYAQWEDGMREARAYPDEVSRFRRVLKACFRAMPPVVKSTVIFCYGYVVKFGFLDGSGGLFLARKKATYYLRSKR